MKRFVLPLAAAVLVSACQGSTGKDNPFQDDPEEEEAAAAEEVTRDTELDEVGTGGGNTVTASTAPGGDSITVNIFALDGTPNVNEFTRNADLDVPGFLAYTAQEDALDRMYVALSAQSADGSVFATAAGDGGQFGQFSNGTYYEGNGVFTPPAIGPGPARARSPMPAITADSPAPASLRPAARR